MKNNSKRLHASIDRRILIVDDDRDFADSLAHLLTLENYKVRRAYSKAGAWKALEDFVPDVALIDIRLGQGSGLTLLAEFRDRHPDVMCVMMTAFASVTTATEALQEGTYDYLCKPILADDLTATLDRCFERLRLTQEREEAVAALKRRNQELEHVNARLHHVVRSMKGLSTCTTLQGLCSSLLMDIARNMAASGGSVYLRQGDQLILKEALDPGHAPSMISLPLCKDSVFGKAIESGLPVSVSDLQQEEGLDPSGWSSYGSDSFLAFPLIGDDQEPIGVLSVHSKRDAPFTQQDRELGLILISFGCEAIRVLRGLEDVAKSEERLRKIIDNSPSAIILKDFEGRYLLVNKRFEEWYGCKASKVTGKTSYDVFPKEIAWLYTTQDEEVLVSSSVIDREIEVSFADGTAHSLLVTKFPVLDSQGNPIGVGAISTDVTDRKRVEEQLRQALKMEALGLLTGGVAHDFNNLLAVILGNLDLIKDQVTEREDLQELMSDAIESARSGADLTHRLLAFGRRQTLHPQTTDVGKLVTGMSRLLERALEDTIEIERTLAKKLWRVEVDRNQLEMSLLNLVINARDAMPNNGRLVIETSNAKFDQPSMNLQATASAGQYVLLAVRDNGTGMSAEVVERALEPFFTTKEADHGSGLGLSMVYGFVKQSGGYMEIDSQLGKGTTVKLYLPKAKGPSRRARPHIAPVQFLNGRGERILVVEDKPKVRRLAKNTLNRLGYEVLEACDGDSALSLLAGKPKIDLLFTDVMLLGGMNGVQLAKQARALVGPTLKVLYTSGYAQQTLVHNDIANEEIKLLNKPFRKDELARAVRTVLEDSKA